jgi:hypothetical protein
MPFSDNPCFAFSLSQPNPSLRLAMLRVVLCSVLLIAALPLVAQEQKPTQPPAQTDVALALVLAVDASGSVSNDRFELQKQGYAAAFRNRRVLNSIQSLTTQSIAVTMMQWTGPELHVQTVGWMLVKDEASVNALADTIEASTRQLFGGGTSISGAIDYSRILLAASPYLGIRRVIDISGDGSNNRGRAVTSARDEAVHDGISINGLPILSLEPDLDRYYYDRVIGGPGAFMVAASGYDTFADAILRKLITEIAGADPTRERIHPAWDKRSPMRLLINARRDWTAANGDRIYRRAETQLANLQNRRSKLLIDRADHWGIVQR